MSLCLTFFLQSCVFCENGTVLDGDFWHELSVNSTQGCVGVHRSLRLGPSPSFSQRLSSFKRYHSLLYRITENEYKDREGGEEAADLTVRQTQWYSISQEAVAGRIWVWGHSGLTSKILSQKIEKNNKQTKRKQYNKNRDKKGQKTSPTSPVYSF